MSDIKVPPEINYAEVYFTLCCNLKCSYCINNYYSKLQREQTELEAEDFAYGLNRIDWKDLPITIGGGEPTLRKDFYTFINLLREEIHIDLLTNLEFDVNEFVDKVSPLKFNSEGKSEAYKNIRVSYHPQYMNPNELVKKTMFLQDNNFSIGIFGINHPLNMKANIEMSEISRKAQVYFFIKDFLGEYEGKVFGFYKYPDAIRGVKEDVMCRTRDLLIAPDGRVYRCHRDLYLLETPLGHILDPDFKVDYHYLFCPNFGECHPCEAKQKTNRFFDMGNCTMEILKSILKNKKTNERRT